MVIEAAKLNGIPVLRIYSDNEKSYGLVSVLKGKYFCFCCKKNFCGHTKLVRNPSNVENVSPLIIELQEFEKSLKDEKNTSKKKGTCKSYLKVPFKPDLLYSETLKSLPGNLIFVPDEVSCCHCGGELDRGDPVLNEWIAVKDAIVITNTILEKANVYYRPCLNCDTITDFDGLNKCILNMGNYMVGHDVLRSYMHSFLHGRRPLFTFYNVFVDVHEDYGNISIKDEFSYHQFRFAWLSFFDLLDINMTEGFSCPVCERDGGPDTIICDGTSVSFQRRMWTWKELGIQHKTTNQIPSFRDRIYIADASCRDLLYRFAAGGEVIRGKFTPSLSVDEKDTLKDKLKKYPYLDNFIHSVDDGSTKLKKEFLKFVTSIASKSPVCGYIHPTKDVELLMNELISGMEIKSYPDKWKSLHENIPVLFDIMENTSEKFAPPELRPLLKELLRLSLKPFENCLPCDENEECDDAEEMSFFPSLPQIRKKYTYLMDTTKPKKSCSKTYRGHPSLLPGVFTLFCPHGICYGFQVMPNNESPKIPFNILKTRFKKAPRFVIYDNACALHSYCLNREPEFFKETIFLVDRLHWDNHSGCSCGYRLNLYPELKNLNSQINEQANAGLKRIKDQVSYMTAQNFMNHSSFYLWNKNMKKRSKL
ncbi:uncharacterized protein LOC126827514 isoform X2 [Patella vulgata]|uniref:uncharacterized protein LOC126821727 isoform X2 n=1 Tax=Patella vulgata TaxID=6465 RepID=UPI0021806762|nr:uncharacterized protein LOC126821727 isoform X2 [Patella vulgata]XP_050412895.1 uncharacterized protein LOC126827514 isoform X2 [Patella vulgata]